MVINRTSKNIKVISCLVVMFTGVIALTTASGIVAINKTINTPLREVEDIEVVQIAKGVDMLNLAEVNSYNSKPVENSDIFYTTLDSISSVDKMRSADFEKRDIIKTSLKGKGDEPVPDVTEEIVDTSEEIVDETYGIVTYEGDGTYGKFKSYMDKDTITARGSLEYKQKEASYIDENGIACLDGRMLIAVGTGHNAPVGSNLDVYLSSGKVLKCKVGDTKSDRDTMSDRIVHSGDGSIIEFIVETDVMDSFYKQMGDLSHADMQGGIVKIVKVD